MTRTKPTVICPFCCYRFGPHQADFRLPTGRKAQDTRLYTYLTDVLLIDKNEAKKQAAQMPYVEVAGNMNVQFNEADMARYGFVRSIDYVQEGGKKIATDKRLCPHCHNDLPTGYGMRDTLLISILGDARVGKSVFLTILINELENNADFVSKLTFIGAPQVRDAFYENYQRPLLKEKQLIASTKRKKMPPFAFNYWYQFRGEDGQTRENNIDLIFYDIAGEDLRDDDGIRKHGFNIKDSSGLIFLVDPTNFVKLSDLFRFTDAALIEAIPKENSVQQIFNTLYNYFLGMNAEKSDIPLALLMSKSDLLSYVNFDFFANRPENRIQNTADDEGHRGALNMRAVKGIDREIKELFGFLGEDRILNNALGCFKHVNFFAVSSLGKKPTVEKISDPETNETIEKGYVDGTIEPFRVKDAFYWLLMRNGLMAKQEGARFHFIPPQVPDEGEPGNLFEKVATFFEGVFMRIFKRKGNDDEN